MKQNKPIKHSKATQWSLLGVAQSVPGAQNRWFPMAGGGKPHICHNRWLSRKIAKCLIFQLECEKKCFTYRAKFYTHSAKLYTQFCRKITQFQVKNFLASNCGCVKNDKYEVWARAGVITQWMDSNIVQLYQLYQGIHFQQCPDVRKADFNRFKTFL